MKAYKNKKTGIMYKTNYIDHHNSVMMSDSGLVSFEDVEDIRVTRAEYEGLPIFCHKTTEEKECSTLTHSKQVCAKCGGYVISGEEQPEGGIVHWCLDCNDYTTPCTHQNCDDDAKCFNCGKQQ